MLMKTSNQLIFVIIMIVVVAAIVNFIQTPTGKVAGGTDFPYFVSPNSDSTSGVINADNPFGIMVAIPGNYSETSTKKVAQIQYDYYWGDDSTPYSVIIQDPADLSQPKRIKTVYYPQNGADWTMVSSFSADTTKAIIYTAPSDSLPADIHIFPSGVTKIQATITLHDSLTGSEETVYTQTRAGYLLVE